MDAPIGDFIVKRGGSVDPANYADELFDLYSIPAYDRGKPDVVTGAEIGSSKQIVQPGDVLLSRIVPHIRRAWVVGADNGRRLIASGEWIIFRSPQLAPAWLRHMLLGDRFHREFMATVAGVGGSLLRARPAQVAQISIPMPPLDEQRRIAAILDKADGIRMKHLNAAGGYSILLIAQWTRAIEGRNWADVALDDVATFIRGVTYKPEDVDDAKSPETVGVLRTKNVQQQLDLDDVVYVPRTLVRRDDKIAREGDILISSANSWSLVGKCCWVPCLGESYAIGGFITALRATSTDVDPRFLYRWFASSRVQASVRSTANQTTNIANLNLKRCAGLRFPLPALDEQHRIVDLLDQSDDLRRKHLDAAEHTSGLLLSLSGLAFTGRL